MPSRAANEPLADCAKTNCPSSVHQTLFLWMRVWPRKTVNAATSLIWTLGEGPYARHIELLTPDLQPPHYSVYRPLALFSFTSPTIHCYFPTYKGRMCRIMYLELWLACKWVGLGRYQHCACSRGTKLTLSTRMIMKHLIPLKVIHAKVYY